MQTTKNKHRNTATLAIAQKAQHIQTHTHTPASMRTHMQAYVKKGRLAQRHIHTLLNTRGQHTHTKEGTHAADQPTNQTKQTSKQASKQGNKTIKQKNQQTKNVLKQTNPHNKENTFYQTPNQPTRPNNRRNQSIRIITDLINEMHEYMRK